MEKNISKEYAKERAKVMLREASTRYKAYMMEDGSYYNMLAVLNKERDEAHAHSKMIFFLLNRPCSEDGHDDFLKMFLQILKIPEEYLHDKWIVYRERPFSDGRMDFVIESERFCVVIEMKIDAGDGERQLERYDSYCRKRGKAYQIFYLTIDGHAPDGCSTGKMDLSMLSRISFQKEIVEWLEKCMDSVGKYGYKYTLLKQYMGAVRHMAGMDEEKVNVDDLLTDAEAMRAALLISGSFLNKMDEIMAAFMEKVKQEIIQGGYEAFTEAYGANAEPGITIVVERKKEKKESWSFVLALEAGHDSVYACLGFVKEIGKNRTEWRAPADVEERFPKFYQKWMEKVKKLHLQNARQSKMTTWFPLENTRGQVFDFYNYSQSVLELVDEMDIQCTYVAKNLIAQILEPFSV